MRIQFLLATTLAVLLGTPSPALAAKAKTTKAAPKAAAKAPSKAEAEGPWRYSITYRASAGLVVDVLLNDVQVLHKDGEEDSSGGLDANAWVMPGENALRVKVRPRDPKMRFDPLESFVLVRLTGAATPEALLDAKPLVEIDLDKQQKARLPVDLTAPVTIPHPPQSQLWIQASPITLDEQAKTAALALATELYDAYAKKDAAKLATMIGWKTNDERRARQWPEVPADTLKDAIADALATLTLPPLKPEELSVQLVAGGRLLWVSRAGAPFLSWKEEDGESSVELYVARLNDSWIVAR